MKRVPVMAASLVAALLIAATSASAKPLKPVWMTTNKVEHYLEHDIKAWGGVKLAGADFKLALCLQGDYSKAETRIGKTYKTKTTAAGEELYASFACTLAVSGRSFNLYIRPQAHNHWLIVANR